MDELAGTLGIAKEDRSDQDVDDEGTDEQAADGKPKGKRKNNCGTRRRKLRDLPLEEERIEISDSTWRSSSSRATEQQAAG